MVVFLIDAASELKNEGENSDFEQQSIQQLAADNKIGKGRILHICSTIKSEYY